jgi:hypothetical protein
MTGVPGLYAYTYIPVNPPIRPVLGVRIFTTGDKGEERNNG